MKKITPTIVLLYYDFPQVFIGKDIVDLSYICMVTDENEFGPSYICTPISKSRIEQIQTSNIDLLDVYSNPEIDEFFECSSSQDGTALHLQSLSFSICPEEYLPEQGVLFDGYDEVASKALELNSTVAYASLSVAESESSPRIRTAKLSEFLILYQNAIKYLTKLTAKENKISIGKGTTPFSTDVFGFSYGSFTVQLQSSYSGDLLGDNALLAGAFKKLNEMMLLTEDAEEAILYLKNMKGHTAGSLIKLLEFMADNACPVKHQWATPNMAGSSVAITNLSNLRELVELCKQRDDLFSEDVLLTGYFTIANSDANTWKIIDENGNSSSGSVDPDSSITLNGITIREKKYNLVCKETVEVVLGTSREVKKLLLTKLEVAL